MNFLEKNLEDIIFETENDQLESRGLRLLKNKKRQLRIGNYGIADLICWDYGTSEPPCLFSISQPDCPTCKTHDCNKKTHIDIQVLELKQQKIDVNAFMQSIRYTKGITEYLKKRNFDIPVNYEIILIGCDIDKSSSFIYLADIFDVDYIQMATIKNEISQSFGLRMFTYKYAVDGIKFNQEYGYSLIDSGFNLKPRKNEHI